jgi:hypothetical protein
MNSLSVSDVLAAAWWPELLSVKDSSSWGALVARFGVPVNTLRSALAAAGQTKAPQPAGRKPGKAAAPAAPPAPPAPATSPALVRFRNELGKRPDSEVAVLAGVSPDAVKAYRRTLGVPPFRRLPPGSPAAAAAAVAASRKEATRPDAVVVRRRDTDEVRRELREPERAPLAAAESGVVSGTVAPVGALSKKRRPLMLGFRKAIGCLMTT